MVHSKKGSSSTNDSRAGSIPEATARDPRHHGGEAYDRPVKFVQKATPAEARVYDFPSLRGPQKTTSIIESIGHLVKGCLGGGVVSIHESYKGCGLFLSLILNVVLGMLISYCVHILVKSAQKTYGRVQIPRMSYPDIAEAAVAICPFPSLRKYDKCLRYAVDVTITIDLFGSCCVYMVVMARTIKQLVAANDHIDNEGIRWYILYLLLPCIVITWILELKYLAPFSIVADFFIVTVALSTIYYGFNHATHSPFDTNEFPIFVSVGGMFEFIGACVFSMEGVGVSMAIENHMTHPKKFPVVLVGGMSVVVSMVMIVGFFGFWGYGQKAMSPVTVNFPWSPFSICLKVFMALMTYVTFALNFWVPFDLVWYYIRKKHNPAKYWFWERFYRSLIVIGICIVAVIFPDVSAFIGLLGALALSNMGFIYPALIELLLDWDDPGLGVMKWRLWKCVGIVIFGIVLCTVGSYVSLAAMIKNVYG